MGYQLSTVLHRLGGVQGERPWPRARPAVDVVAATAERARALLPRRERSRYDEVLGHVDDAGAEVLRRVIATTWSTAAVAEVAEVWSELSAPERRAVHDPVRHLAADGRQSDATTCGSAVLTMLAAAGDPALALWLATGRTTRHAQPPELAGAPTARVAALATGTPAQRFAPVQRVVKNRTNARAAGPVPWPSRLGTPPWGAAREARFVGLAFTGTVLDDTDSPHLDGVIDEVHVALDHGVPVPLYCGGDTDAGVRAAVPRHVVLAVSGVGEGLLVWEPAAGRLSAIDRTTLLAPAGPSPALGGWTHLSWAVLPVL